MSRTSTQRPSRRLLAVDRDRTKTEVTVKGDARRIRRESRQHQLVEADLAAKLDQAVEQRAAGALRACGTRDVHGDVRDVPMRIARVEDIETRPPDHHTVSLHNEHRMPGVAGCEPTATFVGRA